MTIHFLAPRSTPSIQVSRHPHSASRFFELSLDLLCIASTDGYLRRVNPAFQRILGWTEDELLSRNFFEFIHPDDIESTQNEMLKLNSGLSILSFEHRLIRSDGALRVVLWTAFPDNDAGVFYAVGHDISERKKLESDLHRRSLELERANDRLARLATTDELTNLANRRALNERFEEEIQRDQLLALLLIDIDHFKRFNDQFGHPAGDTILRQAGRLLSRCVRSIDCPSRYGGEEFAVLLPGASLNHAAEIADRIVKAFRVEPWATGNVTVSIGVASASGGRCCTADSSWSALSTAADKAMYRAKTGGRDQFQVDLPSPSPCSLSAVNG